MATTNKPVPNTSSASENYVVRPARLSDVPTLAGYATRAYWLSPMNRFLAPRAAEFPDDLPRMFRQMQRRHLLTANFLFFVACSASDPDTPVGHVAFSRLGNDRGARDLVESRGVLLRLWMFVMRWFFWAYDKVDLFLWKPGAFDYDALKQLDEWSEMGDQKYWKSYPERANRWYINGLIINPEYQGKGIGRLLMKEPLNRAQRERVIAGLTSSRHGEFLYRKLGFELLGDFCVRPHTEGPDDKGGGYMIWYPEGYEGARNHE